MNKLIAYPNEEGGVCILIPTGEIPFEEVARKDVPAGVPYRIFDRSELPPNDEFRNAWEVDFSTFDGKGIGQQAWFAEQAAKQTEGA